ncbi:(2Fe-2S)-binding protein [Paracoccus aurantiacus]|uniref:(2Fe-2S)-binding protein n=1 Tax=Paracoccus aurantiacus TaxID=2599412 RepID=A0A5C6S7U3_9RHOB|nr:(2Fe-2S)-binding protein [Paracoccus aurantiacus]TXB70414.1 (2Fe-2S)-binding protein [Paracoccus aurantiacus]
MIVCHCNQITDHDIRAAVGWMRASDPDTIVTPGKVYHALGKRADCGGCMKLFVAEMRAAEGFAVGKEHKLPPVLMGLRKKIAG